MRISIFKNFLQTITILQTVYSHFVHKKNTKRRKDEEKEKYNNFCNYLHDVNLPYDVWRLCCIKPKCKYQRTSVIHGSWCKRFGSRQSRWNRCRDICKWLFGCASNKGLFVFDKSYKWKKLSWLDKRWNQQWWHWQFFNLDRFGLELCWR